MRREALSDLRNWISELSMGRETFDENAEHTFETIEEHEPTLPLKKAASLALVLSELRMDMAHAKDEPEHADSINLLYRRKIEFVERQLAKNLDIICVNPLQEIASKVGVKNKAVHVNAGSKIADENEQDVFDMIQTSYAAVGGNPKIRTSSDVSSEYEEWYLADVDEDPEADLALLGNKSSVGHKIGASATDGTPTAKQFMIQLKNDLMKNGWWAEVSDAPAHIAINKLGLKPVTSEDMVRALLRGKNITWHGEHPEGKFPGTTGWYSRDIGGERHVKTIVGDV